MLDFLDRVPFPHLADLGVRIGEMVRIGEEFVRHHRGIVLQRHGDPQLGDRGLVFRQVEQFGGAPVDHLHVVACVGGEPVERDMLARVVDFLLHEGADFGGQFVVGALAEGFHRFDEEGLPARESAR